MTHIICYILKYCLVKCLIISSCFIVHVWMSELFIYSFSADDVIICYFGSRSAKAEAVFC